MASTTFTGDMTEDYIGYGRLLNDALRNVVKEVLNSVIVHGLPGEHHCYISFRTQYPGVDIPDELREKYPDEMTIVLQHQFWELTVEEKYFSVQLSFNRQRQKLTVPFAALTAYADPSIKFGLQFHLPFDDDLGSSSGDMTLQTEGGETPSAQVISLDSFRKKP